MHRADSHRVRAGNGPPVPLTELTIRAPWRMLYGNALTQQGLQAITNRQPIEIVDVLAGATGAIAIVNERWSMAAPVPERSIEITRALQFTVAAGRLVSCRVREESHGTVDDWISID